MATSESIASRPAFDSGDMFRASEKDLSDVADLIRRELDETATVDYLKWWYLANPSRLFSILAYRNARRIGGMSTIIGCVFKLGSEIKTMGMIQKVLVERELRGKGLFTSLHLESEKDCRRQGVDGFIGIPNAISDPVFLNKCGYVRGLLPDLLMIPFNPLIFLRKTSYRLVKDLNEAFFSRGTFQFSDAMIKGFAYLAWRYLALNPEHYCVLEVTDRDSTILGYAFLKRVKRFGLPFYLLMDISVRSAEDIKNVLSQAGLFCSRRASPCLLLFDNVDLAAALKGTFCKRIRNKFNFIVKGKDAAASDLLSKIKFNLFFGDVDFV